MQNKIIVSAIGYNSVYGTGAENYWKQIQGKHHNLGSSVIEDIDPQKYLNSKGQKFLNKASLIYCNIAFQCIYQRNLTEFIQENPDRIGLYDSSELSNIEACFQFDLIAKNEGPDYVSPMNAPNTIANAAASQMAIQAGVRGPNFTICAGASGSLQAVDVACMHLKQQITDFAIVGSTEVVNKYQMAVRRGEKRNPLNDSEEQGVALLLERVSDESKMDIQLAVIDKFASGTQMFQESKEELIWRLISDITSGKVVPDQIDLCIVSGGTFILNKLKLSEIFEQNKFNMPIVAYPEKQAGAGDNAGGILGIVCAIGIFLKKITSIPTDTEILNLENYKIRNVLVISVDTTGGASVALVSNPNKY